MYLLTEAIGVGILTVLVGTIISAILAKTTLKVDLGKVCKTWNRFYIMEISLFLTGFLIHLLCEMSGINRWYCKNGIACLSK